jgi:phosphatidate cytidylyltransferase
MSNLAQRVLSAVVALPVLAALILWRQPLGFSLFVLLVAGLALSEFATIGLPTASAGFRARLVILGVVFSAGLVFAPGFALLWLLAAFVATAAMVLFDPGDIPGAGARLGVSLFGVLYLGGLCAPLAIIHRDAAHGSAWVLLAIAVTFGNDTGAYFAGRALGRHKLYPLVSPAKSVEGAIGGMAASVAILIGARATLAPWLTWGDCFLVGVPAGVIGPIGDLVESLIKRSGGVKDSGRIIPGHGGVLDRIDALLFVSAWVFVYVFYVRR